MEIAARATAYFFAFAAIWYAAGMVVRSVNTFSHRLHMSSFSVSFVILGILTSLPELTVGLTAIYAHDTEIFIGNLLGGVVVIFLLIIPLLAIVGNGIAINHRLNTKGLLLTLATIALPSYLLVDKTLNMAEGVVMLCAYSLLVYIIRKPTTVVEQARQAIEHTVFKINYLKNIFTIVSGVLLLMVASTVIVYQTEYFSRILNISSFYLSLLLLALGTNIPELSLGIRSVISGQKGIAFGDYLGSAAANTLLFGIFTLLNQGTILSSNNYITTFSFISLGLVLFFFFARTKNSISRLEGIVMLMGYILFLFMELNK